MKKFQIMNGRSASLPDRVKRRSEREGEEQKQGRQGTVQAEQLLGIYRPFANQHPTHLPAIAENSNRIQLTYSVFYQYFGILSVIQYFICLIAIEIPIGSSLNFSSEVSEQSRRFLIESETCERISSELLQHSLCIHIHIYIRFRICLLHSRLHCNSS